MSLTNYVTLGRSGLRVSPLCLGTMTFGTEWGWGAGLEESRRVLHAYVDRGGNFIDTANIYTSGRSEKILGDLFAEQAGLRDALVVATKFGGNLRPGDPNGGGAGRGSIASACEQSLRRLRTDHIDLYWLHFRDRHTPIDETLRALDDLVRAGKVRYIGFSDMPAWLCAQAQTIALFRGLSPLIALQIEYSLVERTVEGELIPMAIELGLGVTPWSPLKGGLLSGRYTREATPQRARASDDWVKRMLTERNLGIIDALIESAREVGSTPARVALAWLQQRPGVTSTIIGVSNAAQLDDNLGALDVAMTPAVIARLNDASKPVLNFPHDFLNNVASVTHGGITINGVTPVPWPLAPKSITDVC